METSATAMACHHYVVYQQLFRSRFFRGVVDLWGGLDYNGNNCFILL